MPVYVGPLMVTVRTLFGKTFEVETSGRRSVLHCKRMIGSAFGMTPERMELLHHDRPLPDTQQLGSFLHSPTATFTLVLKLRTGFRVCR